ncbi:MAG: cyclase family protein [Ilumatobacteraceae bacterium]
MGEPSVHLPRRRFLRRLFGASAAVAGGATLVACADDDVAADDLWAVYERSLSRAKYVSLSHVLEPSTPVWYGFDASRAAFVRARSGNPDVKAVGEAFTYDADGFEATEYVLPTDQFGTQLDPPAHWNPDYPAIDELPVAIALRPLVVISIVDQVTADDGYALSVDDIVAWEAEHGRVPAGSVVMVRSDWSTHWDEPDFATRTPFPGVSLAALKFLHLERHILFHGHEPLDTDSTPTLEGEAWLLTNGYLQAEGVTNLDLVPPTGALVTVGFPRFRGGTGGFASFVAVCPPDWPHGERPGERPESPMDALASPLRWDDARGMRVRD